MSRRVLGLALALGLLATVMPVAMASDAGHTYTFDDTILMAIPAPYASSQAHNYRVEDVQAGTTITATLTWEDDPTIDMDLNIQAPGDVCMISPDEDPNCFIESTLASATCSGAMDPAPPTENERHLTVTAPVDGAYNVSVQAKLAERFERVDYHLTFTLDAPHGATSGPHGATYLHLLPYCGLVEK